LLLLAVLCISSCVSRTKSHFSYGDRSIPPYFPTKVAVQFCGTDPSVRFDLLDALTERLKSAGIDGVKTETPNTMEGFCGGTAPLPHALRQDLRDHMGIQGLFVGTLTQRRSMLRLFTTLELKLIGNPSARMIWVTNVRTDELAAFANIKTSAEKMAELAVESLKKDLFGKSR
jgi:hypothetical protein